MIPCGLDNGKKFIKKILPKGGIGIRYRVDAGDIHSQEFANDLQHQKSIKANATMRVVMRIR